MNDTTGVMEAERSGTDAYRRCELESISWIKEMPETDLMAPLLSKLDDEVKKHSSTLYKVWVQRCRMSDRTPLYLSKLFQALKCHHDSAANEMNRVR
jgi:hypothetical protein